MIYHVEQAHLELISNVQIQSCYPILNFDFYQNDAFPEIKQDRFSIEKSARRVFGKGSWKDREVCF